MLAEGLGNVSSEQVASGILKNNMKRDNIKPGDKFPLKTFGNIFLVVGTRRLFQKRTLGSIDINKLVEDGCKKNHMVEFKNCISPRIIYLDEP